MKKLFIILTLCVTFISSLNYAFAASSVTITRGEAKTINWFVAGTPTCFTDFNGGVDYPNNAPGETVYNTWNGQTLAANDSMTFPSVWGNVSGSWPQVYVFRCHDLFTAIEDTVTMQINQCLSTDAWSDTTHTCQVCTNGGCVNNLCTNGNPGPICPPATSLPTIGSFSSSPAIVNYGQSTTISWSGITDATSCKLSGGQYGAGVSVNNVVGSVGTTPLAANTSYTLSCDGPSGNITQTINVIVASGTISPVSACTILANENNCSTNIAWNTSNVSTPKITNLADTFTYYTDSNSLGSPITVPHAGTWVTLRNGAYPFMSQNLTATCDATGIGTTWDGLICAYNPCSNGCTNTPTCNSAAGKDYTGPVIKTCVLQAIIPGGAPPSGNGSAGFYVSPTPIAYGASSVLTWANIVGATSCSINQGIGNVAITGGSISTGPQTTVGAKTYILTCTNGYTFTPSLPAILTVNANVAPTLSGTPSANATIKAGQSLSYTSTASDVEGNMTWHKFDWLGPGGSWNYSCGNCEGTVSAGPSWNFPAGTSASTQSVTFTPTTYGAPYTVGWSAYDPVAGWQTAYYTITIGPAPVGTLTPVSSSLIYGQSTTFTITGTNADVTSCTLYGGVFGAGTVILPSGFATPRSTGALTSSTNYWIICNNGYVSQPSVLVTINVAANNAPTVSTSPAANQSIKAGQGQSYTGTANDVDSNLTKHHFEWQRAGGSFNYSCGNCDGSTSSGPDFDFAATNISGPRTLTFTPSIYNTTYTAGWAAADAIPLYASDYKTLTIGPAPVGTLTPISSSLLYGQSTSFTITSSNADVTSCTISGGVFGGGTVISPANFSTAQSTGALVANTSYTLTCTNGFLTSAPSNVTIAVSPNNAPTFSATTPAANQTIKAGQFVDYASTANDADFNLIQHKFDWKEAGINIWNYALGCSGCRATVSFGPAWGPFAPTNTTSNALRFTPTTYNTTYTLGWAAYDGVAAWQTTYKTLTVGPAPVGALTPVSSSLVYGGSTTFTITGTNADVTSCTISGGVFGAGLVVLSTNFATARTTGPLITDTVYSLTCTNGTLTSSAVTSTINVAANNAPTFSATTPNINESIVLGASKTYTSTAADTDSNMIEHGLTWTNPSGIPEYNAGGGDAIISGKTAGTYIGLLSTRWSFTNSNSSGPLSLTFRPTRTGIYTINWSAYDAVAPYSNSPAKTLTVLAPSATLTALACDVPIGASTCPKVISWAWTNQPPTWKMSSCNVDVTDACLPGLPGLVDETNSPSLSKTFPLSGDPAVRRVINLWGDTTWTTKLTPPSPTYIRGNCISGSQWNTSTSKCEPSPTITGSITPLIVTDSAPVNNTTSNLYTINYNGANATALVMNCTGGGATALNATPIPIGVGAQSIAGIATPAMYGIATCTIDASGLGGNASTPAFTLRVTRASTLTLNAAIFSTVDFAYNCVDPSAISARFARAPGAVSGIAAPSNSAPDTGLAEDTLYTYTLECYDGANATGNLLSTNIQTVRTPLKDPSMSPIVGTCGNGASPSSAPACDICPAGKIYNGKNCALIGVGTMCGGTVTNQPSGQTIVSPTGVCGNGIVEAGEECDTAQGLFNITNQACSNSCSIICVSGSSDAPRCGLAIGNVCINGAMQSSAPDCGASTGVASCALGQIYTGGICKTPICGNNIKEGSEACDGTDVQAGKLCTYGCCQTLPTGTCYPTLTITCTNSNRYNILSSGGTSVIGGPQLYNIATPPTWTPSSPDAYTLQCINQGVFSSLHDDKIINITGSCAVTGSISKTEFAATPRTTKKGGSVSLTWKTDNPIAVCKIIATPTITQISATCNATCVYKRKQEAERVTRELYTGTTDSNDPFNGGAVRSLSTAFTSPVSGSTQSQGKKSVSLKYSTEFIASCGLNPLLDINATRVKVNVANDIEN